MNLYEAIGCRRSIRKYKPDRISEQLQQQIAVFYKKVSALNGQIEIDVEIVECSKEKKGPKGLWKVDAPYYLVLYSEPVKGYERNAGYILEQIVLYLTTKGLGSCYWGGGQVGSAVKDGKKRVMAVAFGYPDQKLYRDSSMAKRLPLNELCVFKEEVGEHIKTVLKAARLSPSAFNSQPWRFIVYSEKIYIFARREALPLKSIGMMREFSMGIMFAHLMLASEELWMEMESFEDVQYAKKSYKNGDYILTISLR